jgi:hypothetical protein
MTQWWPDREQLTRDPSEFGADALQRRATAAYMLGRYQESVDSWDRAHSVLLEEGDAAGASRYLFWLLLAIAEDDVSAAPRMGGHLARIQRLVEEFSLGELEQTYLDCYACIARFMSAEYEESVAAWALIARIGRAHADDDIWAFGRRPRTHAHPHGPRARRYGRPGRAVRRHRLRCTFADDGRLGLLQLSGGVPRGVRPPTRDRVDPLSSPHRCHVLLVWSVLVHIVLRAVNLEPPSQRRAYPSARPLTSWSTTASTAVPLSSWCPRAARRSSP